MQTLIQQQFRSIFEVAPQLFRSPARINIAGEHMDYNLGITMAAAIDREIVIAIEKNNTRHIGIYATGYDELFRTEIDELKPVKNHWSNYITGVVAEMIKLGKPLTGFNCVFGGNIPQGAGLSSSAAVTSGFAYALNQLFKLKIPETKLAQLCMQAEHNFANVKCGLLDPMTALLAKKDFALLLNFKTLEHSHIKLDTGDFAFLLFNSHVRHNLSESGHLNDRFESCYRGVNAIQARHKHIEALCDADLNMLKEVKDQLNETDYNRCRYILEEMNRFLLAKAALEGNSLKTYGKLMFETHAGMRDLYEISCPELNVLVDFAHSRNDIAGARMTGGGFGGCTLNLVQRSSIEQIKAEVAPFYYMSTGKNLSIIEVNFVDGVACITGS